MNKDPLDTASQEAADAERAMSARLEAQRDVEDLKWLMSSKRGRRIVWRLLQEAGIYRSSFNTNALQMSFNEGNRNAGLRLLAAITEAAPERCTEMTTESRQ